MDAYEAIITRRSIRKYKEIPVPVELIGMVCEAGRNAPSAGNLQPWRFIIITDEGARKEIAEACMKQYWMEQAPVHIVVCAEPWKNEQFYGQRGTDLYLPLSAGAAIQNMLITAHSQELGACWVSALEVDMLRAAVGLSNPHLSETLKITPVAVVTLGYPDEVVPAPMKYRFENQVYINGWQGRITDVDLLMKNTHVLTAKAIDKTKGFFKKVSDKIAGKKEK